MSEKVKVVVTGAAGQIGYSLVPRLLDGVTFGNKMGPGGSKLEYGGNFVTEGGDIGKKEI